MNEKKLPAGARKKLPFWFPLAWSSRAVALSMNMSLTAFMTLYFTDVLGLNPAIIGIMLMVSRISDAVTDIMIGYIVDRTKTRWGKARPYEFAIVFLWLFIFMMYSTPYMSPVATYVWVFFAYFMQNSICITVLYGNEPVYLVRAVKYPENRTRMISAAGIYQMVIVTAFGMIIPQMVARIGTERHKWSMLALCIAVPCALIGMFRFLFVPELKDAVEEKKEEKISVRQALNALKGNKYLWILAVMYFFYHFANGFSGGMATYFTKWNMGDLGIGTWLNAAALFALPILAVIPKFMDKCGTAKTLRIGLIIMALGPVVRWLGGTSLAMLMVGTLMFIAGSVPIAFMTNIYLFECMDYGEWKLGTRVEGIMGSVNSCMAKLASAVSGALQGILLIPIGYVGTAEAQSKGTLTGIMVLFNLVPLLICVFSLLLSTRYDVEKDISRIREELKDRAVQIE